MDSEETDLEQMVRIKKQMRAFRELMGLSIPVMARAIGEAHKNYEAYEYIPSPGATRKMRWIGVGTIQRFCAFAEYDLTEFITGKPRSSTGVQEKPSLKAVLERTTKTTSVETKTTTVETKPKKQPRRLVGK